MGPQPRELQPNDIFLYKSLGIEFYEPLFILTQPISSFYILFIYKAVIYMQIYMLYSIHLLPKLIMLQ